MDETTPSPLAPFPNEHPESLVLTKTPFYRSRMFLFGCIALVLLATGIAAGTLLLGKNETKPQTVQKKLTPSSIPTQPLMQSTSSAITASWNTYTNTSYGYDVKYEKDSTPKEMNTPQYGYSDFANGCMKVYAVHNVVATTLPEEKNGIPWKQLKDLQSLPVGQNRNCSVLTFTFDAEGKSVVDRNDYTRLKSENINGSEWYAFTVKNAESAVVTTHNVYFTEKNNTTYVIETKTGGSCPTTPKDMLSTFSFTQ